ncbi:MAG TPA: hypothetical protein V6C88_17270 [Chroococcidiopsis sp.]
MGKPSPPWLVLLAGLPIVALLFLGALWLSDRQACDFECPSEVQ